MAEKTMIQQIEATVEEVQKEMCDSFCKYPHRYFLKYNDVNEAYERMLDDVCANCPLNRL